MAWFNALVGVLVILNLVAAVPSEYRSYSGINNNLNNTQWGMANTAFVRLNIKNVDYADGAGRPRFLGAFGSLLPSPRLISNTIFDSVANPHVSTPRLVSDFHTWYGMFITGDTSNSPLSFPPADFPMVYFVPRCDLWFDSLCWGNKTMIQLRSMRVPGTGTGPTNPRQFLNTNSHFFDLSNIYGTEDCQQTSSSCTRLTASLRSFVGGKIIHQWYVSPVIYVPQQTELLVGGDVRINKTPPVTAYFEIFYREHNRLCDVFAQQYPDWTDEQLFQESRRWVIAFHQKVATREWLASLMGEPLAPYTGYNPNINPGIEDFFGTGALRYGHAELNSDIRRSDNAGNTIPEGDLLIRDCMFQPKTLIYNGPGINPVIYGLANSIQGLIGSGWVDDVRNMNFATGITRLPNSDLLAANIQRSRDHGIPPYNAVRIAYGLPPLDFDQIDPDNNQTGALLASLYATADDIDPYLGAILEKHRSAANFGDLLFTIFKDQFNRIRDGDRFWYENPDYFTANETAEVYNTTLALLISRNTDPSITLSQNVFFVPERQLPDINSGDAALFSNDGFTQHVDLGPTYRLGWTVNEDSQTIDFVLQCVTGGWVGIGFGPDPNTMKNADIVLSRLFHDGTFEIHDCFAQDVGVPTDDIAIGGTYDLQNTQMYMNRGITFVKFTKPFNTNDKRDKVLQPGEMKIIFAYNPTDTDFVYHGPTRSASYTVDFWTTSLTILELVGNQDGLRYAIAAMVAIVGLLALGVLAMIFLNLKNPVIMYATPLFLVLSCVGVLVSLLAVVTQLPDPTDSLCMANFWLMGMGFILTFGSILVKTWRIYMLLRAVKNLQRQVISALVLIEIVSVLVIIEAAFMIAWTVADPIKVTDVTVSGSTTQYMKVCRSTSDGFLIAFLAYKGIYLIMGLFLAFQVRKIYEEFNESKGIAISIFIVSLVSCFCIPLGFGLRGYPSISLVIEAIGIIFSYAGMLVALFWDKFRVVVLDEAENAPTPKFRDRTTAASSSSRTASGSRSATQSSSPDG